MMRWALLLLALPAHAAITVDSLTLTGRATVTQPDGRETPCTSTVTTRDPLGAVHVRCVGAVAAVVNLDKATCPVARVRNDGAGGISITCSQR